tara:strand:- start:1310 stop:1630 length:321 start_codon:yes stop_codon:yes gene_type:complete
VSANPTETTATLVAINAQQARLSGRLDRLTGKALIQQGRSLIAKAGTQWQVDLADVSHSSSVGIALLVDWQRYSQNKNITLELLNVPSKMKDVIEFSGLTAFLKLN